MKNIKLTIKGKQYEVDILNIEETTAQVKVNNNVYDVVVDKEFPITKTPKLMRTPAVPSTDSVPSISKTSSPDAPKGSGTVKSPLPGVILNIHVNVGDSVSLGQKLITLEAMKMENNINSDKEGKVASISVKKGDTVMEGDILVVIA